MKKYKKKQNVKKPYTNWIIVSCLVFFVVLSLMIILGSSLLNSFFKEKKDIRYNKTVLENLKKKNDKVDSNNNPNGNAPLILYDYFHIGNEPNLNNQGKFRLFQFKNGKDVAQSLDIRAPSNYDYVTVNNKLFWVDVIVEGKNYWVLKSGDPKITINNTVYFDKQGVANTIPNFQIDNSRNNKAMNSVFNEFSLSLNNDSLLTNTLQLNDKLSISGVDTDFAIYSRFLSYFNTSFSIRRGIINNNDNEVVLLKQENIINQSDDYFVADIEFGGSKKALTYGSSYSSAFKFKSRIKVSKSIINNVVFYQIEQLELPSSAIKNPNQVFAWNLPITIDNITISAKYDDDGNVIPIPNVYSKPATITPSYDPTTKLFSLPKHYSSTNVDGILPFDPISNVNNWSNSTIFNTANTDYKLSELIKNNKLIGFEATLSIRGYYEKIDEPLNNLYIDKSTTNQIRITLGRWRIYILYENSNTSSEVMKVFLVSLEPLSDIRLVDFKIILDPNI